MRLAPLVAAHQPSMQRWLWLSGSALAALLCAAWLWTRAPLARGFANPHSKLHGANTLGTEFPSAAARRSPVPASGVTHADPEKRALLRRRLLALRVERTHDSVRRALGASSIVPHSARAADDPKLYTAFINERVRPDLTYFAQTCYEELEQRSPGAHGHVTLGLEFLADRELGGIINGVLIRAGATLSDETFDACLRDSFLSIYFDPPPSGGRAAINLQFRFEDGNVAAGEQVSLVDRHGGRDGGPPSSAVRP